MANLQILFDEALRSFYHTFVKSFDDLMDHILYPTFVKRFSSKISMTNGNASTNLDLIIKTKERNKNCFKLNTDAHIAMKRLENMIKKLYIKFKIVNQEFDPANTNFSPVWSRYYGSLVANLNYLIDESKTKNSNVFERLKKKPVFDEILTKNQISNNAFQLHQDMTALMNLIIPSTNVPLNTIVGLLGYEDNFDNMNPDAKNEQNKVSIDSDVEINSTIENSINHNTSFDEADLLNHKSVECDFKEYGRQWNHFLKKIIHLFDGEEILIRNFAYYILVVQVSNDTFTFIVVHTNLKLFHLIILDPTNINVTGSIDYENPCSSTKEDISDKMKSCCDRFAKLINHKNIEELMLLLKFSLDLSRPWISQYYTRGDLDRKTSSITRDIDKTWMAQVGRFLLETQYAPDNRLLFEKLGYIELSIS